LAEIEMKIEQGKRNVLVSRLFHAKNDKEAVATWKSNLSRILHTFNVRSVGFAWLLLTVHSQTELAINTHVAVVDIRHDVATTQTIVSDVHRDVVNTHATVSDVQRDVVATHTVVSNIHNDVASTHAVVSDVRSDVTSTHTMVSDIHRAVTKSQEGAHGANFSVNITCHILFIIEQTLTVA
jgi:hypothetical protein